MSSQELQKLNLTIEFSVPAHIIYQTLTNPM